MSTINWFSIYGTVSLLVHILGIANAGHAVMNVRSSRSLEKLVSSISDLTFTNNNAIELLIDGKQTFGRMLEAIAEAKDYILLQSYIINDDQIGNEFKYYLQQF